MRDGSRDILGTAVVSAIFSLAVLNAFAITDPGMPLRWPDAGEFVVALVTGLVMVGVARFIDSRADGLRAAPTRSRTRLILFSTAAGVAMGQLILVDSSKAKCDRSLLALWYPAACYKIPGTHARRLSAW